MKPRSAALVVLSQYSCSLLVPLTDPTKDLLIPLHVKHIMKLSSNTTSLAYHLSTHLRMNGVYWGLMALEIMGRGDELKTDELVEFVMSCWDSRSGE